MPAVSIVVRAYNEAQHIGKLLDGIQQQTVKDVQVIVVDSGSTDDTTAIALKHGAEVIHIQPHDFTFGRSLNLGIQHATSAVVVICSAHVYPVFPDWLEKLTMPLANPKTVLTYGKQRGGNNNHFSEQEIFKSWYPEKSAAAQAHPFCNNANAAIRRSLWENHPYNENLPALEDLAWARWVHDQGYGIAYAADAEVVHVHSESWKGIEHRYRREAMAFKQIYPFETFRLKDFFQLLFSNISSDLRAAKKQHAWLKQWQKVIFFRWNQFLGTYRGYHQSPQMTWKLKQTFYYPNQSETQDPRDDSHDAQPISYPTEKSGK